MKEDSIFFTEKNLQLLFLAINLIIGIGIGFIPCMFGDPLLKQKA